MNNINKIREIYRECFGEDREFENLLFKTCSEYLKIYNVDSEPVSFLFALPCRISFNNQSRQAVYIFAAATHKNHQKKGYMGALLQKLIQETDIPLILRPANESLISYYKKFGFTEFTAQDREKSEILLLPEKGFKFLAENTKKTNEGEFIAMALNSETDLNSLYFPYTMP